MNYTPVANPNEGFLSWLGLSDVTPASHQGSYGRQQLLDDIGPADTQKLSRYLELTLDYLCKVFQVGLQTRLQLR